MNVQRKSQKSLIDIAREYGAREPWRVASIIGMAVHYGREPLDVLDEVRRNDPTLFYGSRHELPNQNRSDKATRFGRRERER